MAKAGIYGKQHLDDKHMPGEHRKHKNLGAHRDGLQAGLRLHQGYARSGKAPSPGKTEGVLSGGGSPLSPKKDMFE